MRETIITVAAIFDDVIKSNNSFTYITELSSMIKKVKSKDDGREPQVLSIPFLDSQQNDVPIFISQIVDDYSFTLTRNSLAYRVILQEDVSSEEISSTAAGQLRLILDKNKKVLGIKVKNLTVSIVALQEDLELERIDSITGRIAENSQDYYFSNMGFAASYSQKPSDNSVSYETINYSTVFNPQTNEIGFRTEKVLTAGGFNFRKKQFDELTKVSIGKFLTYTESSMFVNLIRDTYGLSESR